MWRGALCPSCFFVCFYSESVDCLLVGLPPNLLDLSCYQRFSLKFANSLQAASRADSCCNEARQTETFAKTKGACPPPSTPQAVQYVQSQRCRTEATWEHRLVSQSKGNFAPPPAAGRQRN